MVVNPKLAALLLPFVLVACKDKSSNADGSDSVLSPDRKAIGQIVEEPWTHTAPQEHISVRELKENAKLEIITETAAQLAEKELAEKVQSLLKAEDFDALDEMAATFLETKERDIDGGWKLADFYSALDIGSKSPNKVFQPRLALLEKWKEEKPGSQVARIALADVYVSYAWKARGSGWADSVTEDGWKTMGERLEKAGEYLVGAMNEMEVTDPMFFQTALRIMLGTDGPTEAFDNLVAGSLEMAPDYWGTLSQRAHTLLPRWYGETGDWEAFAKAIAEHNAPYGKEQYAIIVFQRHAAYPKTVDINRLDWPLLKEGIQQLLKNYPDSVENISRAAFIATIANDREYAKECFDLLGDRCLPAVWLVNGRMCHYRHWANTGNWK